MPTYEYKCKSCGHAFEKFHSITAAPVKKCPECGKNAVERLISAGGGLIFKGSGFYITDYAKGNGNANAPMAKHSEGKGSSSESSKSEGSKSEGSKSEGSKSEGSKSESSKSEGSKSDSSKSDSGSKSSSTPATTSSSSDSKS